MRRRPPLLLPQAGGLTETLADRLTYFLLPPTLRLSVDFSAFYTSFPTSSRPSSSLSPFPLALRFQEASFSCFLLSSYPVAISYQNGTVRLLSGLPRTPHCVSCPPSIAGSCSCRPRRIQSPLHPPQPTPPREHAAREKTGRAATSSTSFVPSCQTPGLADVHAQAAPIALELSYDLALSSASFLAWPAGLLSRQSIEPRRRKLQPP